MSATQEVHLLADIFDDVEVSQAIVHVGGMTSLDSVVHKLASRELEAVTLVSVRSIFSLSISLNA